MSADIGVITMRDDETAAVLATLRGRDVRTLSSDGGAFEGELTFAGSGTTVRVVCVQGSDAYERLRKRFAPRVVALVGVAYGVQDGVHLGDVVVSDEVVHDAEAATVTPPAMRRAVNEFFSLQGEPIEWGDGPYRVLRGPIGDASGAGVLAVDVFDGHHAGLAAALCDWVAILGISAAGDPVPRRAAQHAAMVFDVMLPVLGHRRRSISSRI